MSGKDLCIIQKLSAGLDSDMFRTTIYPSGKGIQSELSLSRRLLSLLCIYCFVKVVVPCCDLPVQTLLVHSRLLSLCCFLSQQQV